MDLEDFYYQAVLDTEDLLWLACRIIWIPVHLLCFTWFDSSNGLSLVPSDFCPSNSTQLHVQPHRIFHLKPGFSLHSCLVAINLPETGLSTFLLFDKSPGRTVVDIRSFSFVTCRRLRTLKDNLAPFALFNLNPGHHASACSTLASASSPFPRSPVNACRYQHTPGSNQSYQAPHCGFIWTARCF